MILNDILLMFKEGNSIILENIGKKLEIQKELVKPAIFKLEEIGYIKKYSNNECTFQKCKGCSACNKNLGFTFYILTQKGKKFISL